MSDVKDRLKIAILSHKVDAFKSRNYVLSALVSSWRESGHDVFVLQGPGHYREADILILHVNLTVVPESYLEFSKQYPLVVNGLVHDISKSRVSSHLISSRTEYDGEVIVKTDRNYGGAPERRVQRRRFFPRLLREAKRLIPGVSLGERSTINYQVFSSAGEVPPAVWNDPLLVVEKYLPEREGDHYCIRQWVFFGSEEFNQRVHSLNQIVKANNVVHREYDISVPDDLREMRRALGFDYGKFDYAIVDGETILFDANSTPTSKLTNSLSPLLVSAIDNLAQGLYTFIPSDSAVRPEVLSSEGGCE